MKVTKNKTVVTEEIEVSPGEYYFECQEGNSHKMVLTDYDDGEGIDYFYESVEEWSSPYGVRVRKDTIFDGEELPYKFSAFICGISGKKIEKEDYIIKREEVLKRLI